MSIEVSCQSCGKVLRAKDSAAGKTAKCPDCGNAIQIPEAVYDAEEEDWGSESYDDEYDDAYGYDDYDVSGAPADVDANRKPCPMCGEMIVTGAAKCRYCGEVFDRKLAKLKGGRKKRGNVDPEEITKFRREMHGLGGFWIFIGVLVVFLGIALGSGAQGLNQIPGGLGAGIAVVFGILGAIWIGLGVFTCMKHMWAVWVGLVLSYLSLLGNLINLNVCGLIVLAAVIVQAHRCINRARELDAAGIPLDTRP